MYNCTAKEIKLQKEVNIPIRKQNPYQHQFVNVNNNNYTCCAKMAVKEETPKCRKKTVTWTYEMIGSCYYLHSQIDADKDSVF
jgi:hypothetical protein